jgi:glycogen phosphorylase
VSEKTPNAPMHPLSRTVAYFSMEVAVDDGLPTYSGGLGVLAGDYLRAAADAAAPMAAVTLIYHGGFFTQHLDGRGRQSERPVRWSPDEVLERLGPRVEVTIEGRTVLVGAWRRTITGEGGAEVPLYLLDTRLAENDERDQAVTDRLYGGDLSDRLRQEVVLGLGGPAMLRALGHDEIAKYHMNEGHSSLLTLALLRERIGAPLAGAAPADLASVRSRCVFTTHTPVPAGHDIFPRALVEQVLGEAAAEDLDRLGCLEGDELNMTVLGMTFSGFINGVSLRHAAVSQAMFPQFKVTSITNGVHARTWVAPSFGRLLDTHIPTWRVDNTSLRYCSGIPLAEIAAAHAEAKQDLVDEVAKRTGVMLDPSALTIGLARRAAAYKRLGLLLSQPERLRAFSARVGPLQVVCSGKAHPQDKAGKQVIEQLFAAAGQLAGTPAVVYLEDYRMELAAVICAGSDVWLNTPERPYEASGTSGMKAALNGVPSLSILDGWWIEGHVEGVTGWSIGGDGPSDDAADAGQLYDKLERTVGPLFYERPAAFDEVRRSSIALNGSFFTSQRMLAEYEERAYVSRPE